MCRDFALPESEAFAPRGGRMLARPLGIAAVVLGFGACAGPSFTNASSGGSAGLGGQGGTAGAGDHGGANTGGAAAGAAAHAGTSAGGSAGKGGAGGTSGDGTTGGRVGEAGTGSGGCPCGPARYCRADTCFDCSDVSMLDFGSVEEVLDYPDGALRFPRPGDASGSLFFTLVTSNVSELWYAPDVATAPGGALDDGRVPRAALDYFGDPGGLGFDVIFGETASSGQRTLRVAPFDGKALGTPVDGPPPLAPAAADDYSGALARATQRVYFMTTRSGAPELVTGALGSSGVKTVDVKVPAQGGGTCSRSGVDATPWVTSDGRLLLFSAPPVDAACNPIDGDATDVFVAPVSTVTGLPLATAVPLSDVNRSSDTSNETDASFTTDLCTVYFASDGGGAQGHDFRLYRAFRR